MSTRLAQGLTALTLGSALALSGCAIGEAPPPTSQAAPQFTTFEDITKGLGCSTSTEQKAGATKGYKDLRICETENTFLTVLEFNDKAERDAMVNSSDAAGQSFLMLNDTFAVLGPADDIIAAHNKLGTGELVSSTASEEPMDEPPEEGDSSEETATLQTVESGTSATLDGEQIKLTKFDCSRTVLKNALDNPDWDYITDSEQYIDAKAPKGDTWCVLTASWKNVGKKPAQPSQFGNVVTVNDVEYEEVENSYEYEIGNEATEVNPGKSLQVVKLYAVPKGAKINYVQWGYDDVNYTGEYAYGLKVK